VDEARGVTSGLADVSREIGRVVGPTEGPTLIAVAGVHGNEPGGVLAARRVLARLEALRGELRGEVVMLAGNVEALREGRRYLARDLNRGWTDAALARLADAPEDVEQRVLCEAIEAAVARARGEVFLVDLHTTSAPGVPFVIFGDTERQRRFVFELPVPILLGLAAHIDGTLSEYWRHRGLVTLAIEGGQHDDPRAVDNLAAALWVSLASAGNLAHSHAPECEAAKRLLDAQRGALPRVIEVLSRRAITADDRFVMEPGFANLAPAREGQLLARDRDGEIRAPHDGVVILPLYQALGSDGYFWGRAHARG
jgi:predicted deacylase